MAIARIGRDITGVSSVQMPPVNNKAVCRFQNTSGHSITIDKAYGSWGFNYAAAKMRAVIYSDTSSLPDALLATSNEKVGITSAAWSNEFTFPTPLVVAAGAFVWVGVISDTMCTSGFCAAGGTIRFNADTYSDGATATFGASSTAAFTYPFFVQGLDGQLTFGRNSIGFGAGNYQPDREHGERFTLSGSSSVAVQSISVYVTQTSATVKSKAAIYTDTGTLTGTLVAQTVEVTGTTANTWLTLTFSSPPTIAPGDYKLCYITDTNITTPTSDALGRLVVDGVVTEASAWPGTITFTSSSGTNATGVYATYVIVGGGGARRTVVVVG